jgi:phosphoglycolate phosphatase
MSFGQEADGVLFDLDGTLIDTAPDLVNALQRLREELGLPPVADRPVRLAVRDGAAAIVKAGLPEYPDMQGGLVDRYLALYATNVAELSELYYGMAELLNRLDSARIPWGIVTNKPTWLARPLLDAMRLRRRASVLVCGDTLPQRKPDPAPVLYACRVIKSKPRRTWVIGDDQRDIQAGLAAGAVTVLAAYGYLRGDDKPEQWGAQHRVGSVLELIQLLRLR